MFKSYLTIALRSFRQHKSYSVLNIAGLAIGLACVILVVLWIRDELDYDTHFRNSDKIYRIECSLVTEGVPQPMISTDRRMIKYLRDYHSDACDAVTIFKTPTLLSSAGKTSYEDNAYYADSAFFTVFSFEFIAGDPKTALHDSSAAVITEPVALTLFGRTDPIGDTVWFSNHATKASMKPRVVTGVIKESRKASHFHPTVIFSKKRNLDVFEPVYIKFREGYGPDYFINDIWKPYHRDTIIPNYTPEGQGMTLDRLQPITNIHLGGNKWEDFEANGDRSLLYIFAAIGALILSLACTNYINLATARSFSRSREIAVRKVLGASRTTIIIQFLVEAVITALFALLIAFSLVEMILPLFNWFADKHISMRDMGTGLLLCIIILTSLVGLLAGAYPAFFVSSFQPATVMKDMQGSKLAKVRLRQSLIIFQFCISLVMLIATIEIWRQLSYVKNRDLGFNSENVLAVELNDEKVYEQQELVKQALMQHENILNVSATHNVPGGLLNHTFINFDRTDSMKGWLITSMFVDQNFASLTELNFVEGTDFNSSMNNGRDSAYIIINESAKKQLGYDRAVGKKIDGGIYYGGLQGHIVGVVKDFHATSLHAPIQPMALALGTLGRPQGKSKYLLVKLKPGDINNTIAFIRKTYLKYGQGSPFHYRFLSEQFNAQYRKEEKQMMLFNSFTAISLFTSLLGLVGLATFFMKQRTREICIRRISGASTKEMLYIFSKDYMKLIVAAWLLACPVAYFVMRQWMATFAYHVNFSALPFVAAGVLAMSLVLIAVLAQTWVAMRIRPADILRHP